jgi:hypothetical protein
MDAKNFADTTITLLDGLNPDITNARPLASVTTYGPHAQMDFIAPATGGYTLVVTGHPGATGGNIFTETVEASTWNRTWAG